MIERELESLGIAYKFHNSTQLDLLEEIPRDTFMQLKSNLAEFGIHIKEPQKHEVIQKIQDTITELIYNDTYYSYTASTIISKKLNLSYGYISNLFSEHTLNTLENYIILQRIERAKLLILSNEFTLTEIAYKLNYSSVGHLSSQFKKITGLTSTSFVKIVEKRNKIVQSQYLD